MNIAIIGYGKMGKTIEQIAKSKGHTISHIITENDKLDPLATGNVDVAIEFTQPESAARNITFCLQNQIPVVSGTTGWLQSYNEVIKVAEEYDGTFLYSSNFSIGVNLFFELNKWLAEKIKQLGFKAEIEEIHHTEKRDSPSGTAITLAEGIIETDENLADWINQESTDHNQLGIISKRIANVPGTHTVSYESDLETIEIQHTAKDRSVFADGVVLVAEWLRDQKGVCTMSDFLTHAAPSK